jgi:hypothetical protein
MLRQSEASIRKIEEDLQLLTEEQVHGFLQIIGRHNPKLNLEPTDGELEFDFGDLDPACFHELQTYVREKKELNQSQRGVAGQPSILTSPGVAMGAYGAYGSPAPTPLGAGGHGMLTDSESSDSDSDSD